MPYRFAEYPDEPEPEPSPSRGGRPPRKLTATGVLDPPTGPPTGAQPTYKRPYVSFWASLLILLVSFAALLAVALLSR